MSALPVLSRHPFSVSILQAKFSSLMGSMSRWLSCKHSNIERHSTAGIRSWQPYRMRLWDDKWELRQQPGELLVVWGHLPGDNYDNRSDMSLQLPLCKLITWRQITHRIPGKHIRCIEDFFRASWCSVLVHQKPHAGVVQTGVLYLIQAVFFKIGPNGRRSIIIVKIT